MRYQFILDERLGIELPHLFVSWEEIDPRERADILLKWEEIRAKIPDRILELERLIERKQTQLASELDFAHCCRLNSEIAELASIINDLNIWFRVDQEIEPAPAHL